jgi:orotidine-5'-phosphate decarboxylase
VLHLCEKRNARQAGLDGVVCSPLEAGAVHAACGAGFSDRDAGRALCGRRGRAIRKRVTTPARANEIGSDYIVVGRPITADPVADNPCMDAYRRCTEQLHSNRS